jgi:hypothetical protein
LTPDAIPPAALDFTLQVERLYAALIHTAKTSAAAEPPLNEEPGLGGKLLYAGELAPHGRALLVAGNIAGAASLAATADPASGKQAIRDGVADFLVNSLDEALRILKNQIRKRETVAVCIAAAPEAVEPEMLERGVLPDLLPPLCSRSTPFFAPSVPRIELSAAPSTQVIVTWHVTAAPAQWLPRLDAIALDCLPATPERDSSVARRWLRLAPRYLGRLAQGVRILHCEMNVAQEFVARVERAVECGDIAMKIHISLTSGKGAMVYHLSPPATR